LNVTIKFIIVKNKKKKHPPPKKKTKTKKKPGRREKNQTNIPIQKYTLQENIPPPLLKK
jgi:hypothetical protein